MFRGPFKFHSATGKAYQYAEGDTVTYEGKVYECSRATEQSPLQAPNSWGFIGLTEAVVSVNAP